MNILLLGELSGVHQELKESFKAGGHHVVLANRGDTYRKFQSDIAFLQPAPNWNKYLAWSLEVADQFLKARLLKRFDVVQVIGPKFFHWKVQSALMNYILRHNASSVMINTECSNDYNQFVRSLAYRPCENCKLFDLKKQHCVYESAEERSVAHWMYEKVDRIVSTHFEYKGAMTQAGFAHKNVDIPLPIDTRRYLFEPLNVDQKVVIYYGETRYGFKGGKPISEALERLEQSAYKHRVEVIRTSKLSFQDYLAVLKKAHIVIDQALSYSAGMNALFAMALGKVVLTGAEEEALGFLNIGPEQAPMVNIRPDADDIYQKLTRVIDQGNWHERSVASRNFIETYHDSAVIAEKYLQVYRNIASGSH